MLTVLKISALVILCGEPLQNRYLYDLSAIDCSIFITCIPFSEQNRISVWNDGKGIPVVMHKEEKLYVPELIFGHLLTSSNYDDNEKKVTGMYTYDVRAAFADQEVPGIVSCGHDNKMLYIN